MKHWNELGYEEKDGELLILNPGIVDKKYIFMTMFDKHTTILYNFPMD